MFSKNVGALISLALFNFSTSYTYNISWNKVNGPDGYLVGGPLPRINSNEYFQSKHYGKPLRENLRSKKVSLTEVSLPDGRIAGRLLKTDEGKAYYAFQDIPYGKPPIGTLRFKEPVPVDKWDGVLETTENKKICVQFEASSDPRQNEDCLYLNVYTPVKPGRKFATTQPVLVFIHGGSFLSWDGSFESFGPDYFIDSDLVVVTLNYRLGPLGFLTTEDDVIPGNIGLKDQQLALKWVKRNIHLFGGNPKKVTLMGQSAGSVSVGYHLLNKKSTGLFSAAIMESATVLNCWALQKHARYAAYAMGAALNPKFTSENSSEDLLALLQSASVSDLQINSAIPLPSDMKNCFEYIYFIWTPVSEVGKQENALVTGLSHEKLLRADINKVPLLIGINSQEMLLFDLSNFEAQAQIFDNDKGTMINKNLNIKEEKKVPAGTDIKKIYGEKPLQQSKADLVKFGSDAMFATSVARHAFLQSKYTDVYFYQFSYKGLLGQLNNTVEGAEGVGHQEELKYLFRDKTNMNLAKFPEADVKTHKRLVNLWSQFARYRNPTALKLELLENVRWPKVTQKKFSYLDINEKLTVKEDPKEYKRWSRIFDIYADRQLSTY